MDFQEFYAGHTFDAGDVLGAHVTPQGTVFRVYAPQAKKVSLIGSWNNWKEVPMEKFYDGNFYTCTVPQALPGTSYKYKIYGADGSEVDHCDPYGFGMELRPNAASVVRDLTEYTFTDDAWMARLDDHKKKPLNIYEAHLGSWRTNKEDENGWFTYDELAPELIRYVQENGFNCIEVMPLCEYPSDESWGYQNTCYFSPTSRYGTAAQLMKFVDLCHAAGIAVLLDFVPVHFAVDYYALARFDGTCLYEYPHPDVGMSEWGSCNFMHSRGEVRSYLQSSAWFWMEKFHFDGLRMDAVSRLLYWQGDENRGVNREAVNFIKVMNAGLKALRPGCILCAEDSTNYPGVTRPVQQDGLGFDYKWDMGWMNDTLNYFRTAPWVRRDAYHRLTFSMMYYYGENYILPLSHDENVHGKATVMQKMYGNYEEKFPQARAMYMYMMTHPGKKLNFMGYELGHLREWDEKRELDWDIQTYPVHDAFHRYIKELNAVYLKNEALWSRDFELEGFHWLDCHAEERCVYTFARFGQKQTVVAVFNFSGVEQKGYTFDVGTACTLVPLLDSSRDIYGGTTWGTATLASDDDGKITMDVPPFCGILYELGDPPPKAPAPKRKCARQQSPAKGTEAAGKKKPAATGKRKAPERKKQS